MLQRNKPQALTKSECNLTAVRQGVGSSPIKWWLQSPCNDRCDSVEAVLLYKVQFPSKGPVVMWRNPVFLWIPVEKGAPLVFQNLCFYLGKKCWALPPGWSNFQWDEVILSVTQ